MSRKYERKTRRKTRLLKLNFGPVSNAPYPDVQLDETQWELVERAYGNRLSVELRSRISAILNAYLWQDQSESGAPYLRDAVAAVEHMKTLIDGLISCIEGISDPAGKYALSVITCFARRRLAPQLAAQSVACVKAESKLRRDAEKAGFKEGQAWRLMIWHLLDLAEEMNLPATVGKPNTRQKTEFRPSPFVRFVIALQKLLPGVHWHPPRTIGAVATAISSVRSDRAKTRSHLPRSGGSE
jgi:hypothetical protein